MIMIDLKGENPGQWGTDPEVKIVVVTGVENVFCEKVNFAASSSNQQMVGFVPGDGGPVIYLVW